MQKYYSFITEQDLRIFAQTTDISGFDIEKYNDYQRKCKAHGYQMVLTLDDDLFYYGIEIQNVKGEFVYTYCEGCWVNEICDMLPEVRNYVCGLDRIFESVADCLYYLADEGYLCGGDSIEFIADEEDEDKVIEVRTFGAYHSFMSSYKILG